MKVVHGLEAGSSLPVVDYACVSFPAAPAAVSLQPGQVAKLRERSAAAQRRQQVNCFSASILRGVAVASLQNGRDSPLSDCSPSMSPSPPLTVTENESGDAQPTATSVFSPISSVSWSFVFDVLPAELLLSPISGTVAGPSISVFQSAPLRRPAPSRRKDLIRCMPLLSLGSIWSSTLHVVSRDDLAITLSAAPKSSSLEDVHYAAQQYDLEDRHLRSLRTRAADIAAMERLVARHVVSCLPNELDGDDTNRDALRRIRAYTRELAGRLLQPLNY